MYISHIATRKCRFLPLQNPIDISRSQMSAFDDLTEENSDLINNFRPTQPLNGRIVYDMDTTQQVGSLNENPESLN